MKGLATALLAIGALIALPGLLMDTTVATGGSRVHNIGLLSRQGNLLAVGALFFLSGVVLWVLANARRPPTHVATRGADPAAVADLKALLSGKGKTGIVLSTEDGRTVLAVTTGSAAADAGVQPGDRVVQVDGVFADGDYRAVSVQLAGEPGSVVDIVLRRGVDPISVRLVRR